MVLLMLKTGESPRRRVVVLEEEEARRRWRSYVGGPQPRRVEL